MLSPDLPDYWNGLPFQSHQVPRKLNWLLARGEIRQLITGLYVDVRVPDTQQLRADALRLVVPPNATVCGRAAAWLHGLDATALSAEPFRPQWTATAAAYFAEDSNSQAAQILRYADGRAASPGESWLRLRLIDAGFGRAELQVPVTGPERNYRLDLGYPDRPVDGRRLGLEYDSDEWHSTANQQLRDETRRTELDGLGWHVISVRRTDLWGSYPALELAVGAFLCQQPRLPRRW